MNRYSSETTDGPLTSSVHIQLTPVTRPAKEPNSSANSVVFLKWICHQLDIADIGGNVRRSSVMI